MQPLCKGKSDRNKNVRMRQIGVMGLERTLKSRSGSLPVLIRKKMIILRVETGF